MALKLEQSAKEVAQRPPPWRDKLQPRKLRERKEAEALEKQKGTANAEAKQLLQVNTVLPVASLLQDLHTKVSNDATVEIVAVKACSEWCLHEAQDDSHQQETRNADIGSTKAAVENDAVQVESSEAGIASLVNGIAASDVELAAVEAVSEKERTDYNKSEGELMQVMDTLESAISNMQKETSKRIGHQFVRSRSVPEQDDWQETLKTERPGLADGEPKCDRGSELFVTCNPVQRHEATSQEGVKKYHFCLSIPFNSLWEALEMKARSPEKFMNVSDVKVTDEDGYLIRNMTIKTNSNIVTEQIWISPVSSEI